VTTSDPLVVSGAVEGVVDEAVLRRLVELAGAKLGPVYGKNGKKHLQQKINGYNHASRISQWVVLVDLDHDANCAPSLRDSWLPKSSPYMHFRVSVHAVEAWLLADRESLSAFLGVPTSRIPIDPEAESQPKRTLVELARHSRRREIREDMAPRPSSGRMVGPGYTSRLIEFVADTAAGWQPDAAARSSDSLNRCLRCLRQLAGRSK
jgi:hypothetical protein